MTQDSINVFPNPVDSLRVAAQDVTSNEITNLLDSTESFYAFWNLIIPEYIIFVCICYYIVVTRIPAIKTNAAWKRNLLLFVLAVMWGYIELTFRHFPWLDVIATGLVINAAYEYLFKWFFRLLEKVGWAPLPQWYVEEIKVEKQKDIQHVEQAKKNSV